MNRVGPTFAPQRSINLTENKDYKKALRFIYRYGQETNKLTDEAVEACKRQGINTDDLSVKTVEDFARQLS